jgi:hypothetical protein
VPLSKICIGLNEEERALDFLWKGYEVGAIGLLWVNLSPTFDSIRTNRRFTDLLHHIFNLKDKQ